MTVAEALKLLQLTTPTTANALKTSYRRFSKLEHPDKSKHPQAKERFARVNEAYTLLKDDTTIIEQEIVAVTHTEEGDEIAKLGTGLGPTTNVESCSSPWTIDGRWLICAKTCLRVISVWGIEMKSSHSWKPYSGGY